MRDSSISVARQVEKSFTTPPTSLARSNDRIRKTAFEAPAAAQTRACSVMDLSSRTRTPFLCGKGGTPPMLYPVVAATSSGVPGLRGPPTTPPSFPVSTLLSPEITATAVKWPTKTTLLAISDMVHPRAWAARGEVRVLWSRTLSSYSTPVSCRYLATSSGLPRRIPLAWLAGLVDLLVHCVREIVPSQGDLRLGHSGD